MNGIFSIGVFYSFGIFGLLYLVSFGAEGVFGFSVFLRPASFLAGARASSAAGRAAAAFFLLVFLGIAGGRGVRGSRVGPPLARIRGPAVSPRAGLFFPGCRRRRLNCGAAAHFLFGF